MKEVCEAWNISQYCELTGDTNVLQVTAEVPLIHTVATSEVCLFSDVNNVRVCKFLSHHQMAKYYNELAK
jgi:hypothetical protein